MLKALRLVEVLRGAELPLTRMLALHDIANLAVDGGTVLQLREDVTRFRYGDEQHLDEALTRIFQFGRQKGIPRRS